MIRVLYGSLKYRKRIDIAILPIKYLYIVYTFPFLVFAFMLSIRSAGAFCSESSEEFGIIKIILLHMSAILISFAIWGTIWTIITK